MLVCFFPCEILPKLTDIGIEMTSASVSYVFSSAIYSAGSLHFKSLGILAQTSPFGIEFDQMPVHLIPCSYDNEYKRDHMGKNGVGDHCKAVIGGEIGI